MVSQAITSFICDMRYVLESAVGEKNFSIMFKVSVFFSFLVKYQYWNIVRLFGRYISMLSVCLGLDLEKNLFVSSIG